MELAVRKSAVSKSYEFWSVEGKPVSIHLRASVAGQIRKLANISSGNPPVENGGILWGRIRDTGEGYYLISIEEIDTVSCDHERGEGWALSENDRRQLGKRLQQKRGDLQPVGYWRSHRRLGLYLDKRDLDLMEAFFPQPWSVVLCVRPPATAGYFIWENGDIRRTSSYREFELPDAVQLAVAPSPPRYVNWRKWAATAAVAAALITTPFLLKSTDPSTPFNQLSMRAHTRPGVVRLSWDTRSNLLRDATGAVVWIADGPEESKLELTREQVRAGSLEYIPFAPNVNFRMQVGQFMESLSVEAALLPGKTTDSPPVVVASARNQSGSLEAPRVRRARTATRKLDPPRPVRVNSDQPMSKRLEDVPAPPQVAMAPARFERPPLPQQPINVPKVSATVEKPGSSPLKKVFGWMIPGRKKDFVPAKPVRQVQPHVAWDEPTSVAVRVEIDQKGVVRDADLLTKRIDGHLGRSAVEAAKRWRFEPARQEDRPVESSMVVKFLFGGSKN